MNCLSQIPSTGFDRNFSENELYYRFAGKVPIAGAYSHFFFEKKGRMQKIMQQLKYGASPQIGLFLGKLIAARLQDSDFVEKLQVIVPVPLHNKRQITRGYNQSERIATGIGRSLGVTIDTNRIRRKKHTSTQTAMSRDERWENVKDAFEVVKPMNHHILLVDDVITTGATLEACIRSLLSASPAPASIRIASVGIARKM